MIPLPKQENDATSIAELLWQSDDHKVVMIFREKNELNRSFRNLITGRLYEHGTEER
jgi:hypothetical protein